MNRGEPRKKKRVKVPYKKGGRNRCKQNENQNEKQNKRKAVFS